MCMYRLENLKAIGLQYLSCISGSLRREKGMEFYVFEKEMIAYLPYATFIRLLDALASLALAHVTWPPTNRHSLCWFLCNLIPGLLDVIYFLQKVYQWAFGFLRRLFKYQCNIAQQCCRTPFSLSHGGGGGRHQIAGKGERELTGSAVGKLLETWKRRAPLTCNHLLAIQLVPLSQN